MNIRFAILLSTLLLPLTSFGMVGISIHSLPTSGSPASPGSSLTIDFSKIPALKYQATHVLWTINCEYTTSSSTPSELFLLASPFLWATDGYLREELISNWGGSVKERSEYTLNFPLTSLHYFSFQYSESNTYHISRMTIENVDSDQNSKISLIGPCRAVPQY